ncbi:unnamed protein product, partial [Mycena citricolor]
MSRRHQSRHPHTTRSEVEHYHPQWWYIWIPLFGAFIWFGTILSMLITWLAQGGTGRPRYPSQDSSVPYISDVGADLLKPLFVTGCCITAVALVVSLSLERYLRHSGRLIPAMRRREKVFSTLAVLSAFIGGLGIILLSIFDTKRFPTLHDIFLLVFMVGVVLSALFTCVEYRWISHDFRFIRELRRAYIAKGLIAFILVVLAIAFAATFTSSTSTGAILEWTIALGFTFYMLTFYYDFRMARGVHRNELTPSAVENQRRWVNMKQ